MNDSGGALAIPSHPRHSELAAAFGPQKSSGFGDVTAADLARLSAEERGELLGLLEARAAAQAERVPDDRVPIWQFVAQCVVDAAERSANPDEYLTAAVAHERARRMHWDRLQNALPARQAALSGDDLIESFLGTQNPVWALSIQLATDDGFPPPDQIVPEREPEISEADAPPAASAEPAETSRRREIPSERPALPVVESVPPPPVQVSPPAPVERERPWWTGSGRSDFSGPRPHPDGI